MTEAADEGLVAWERVEKTFGDGFQALRGVDLRVGPGECLALLGRSGSGKTTLLRMVNRLIEPTRGEVRFEGRSVALWDPTELRRAVGYVIQEAGLMPHQSILDNTALGLRVRGVPRGERHAKAREVLQLVGLDPGRFEGLYPDQLSGGQRQRVGVARALAIDPKLILMDEPFGALDPILRRELQDEFRALQARLGMTVVIVTHDIREAIRIGDRLALLDGGRLVQQGTADEFRRAPANDFVREFLRDAEVAEPTAPAKRAS